MGTVATDDEISEGEQLQVGENNFAISKPLLSYRIKYRINISLRMIMKGVLIHTHIRLVFDKFNPGVDAARFFQRVLTSEAFARSALPGKSVGTSVKTKASEI